VTVCPPFTVDWGSIPLIGFLLAVALFQTWFAARAIRRRTFAIYRDPRFNPSGARAVVLALVILAVAWGTLAMTVWLHICHRFM
jgi:hypothetical protein